MIRGVRPGIGRNCAEFEVFLHLAFTRRKEPWVYTRDMKTRPHDTADRPDDRPAATRLAPDERVRFDSAPLLHLFTELGEQAAEDTVYAVLADISRRLLEIEAHYRRHRTDSLPDMAGALAASARRIGLSSVEQVSIGVGEAASRQDPAALGATLARLRRVSDRSISEIWDIGDD